MKDNIFAELYNKVMSLFAQQAPPNPAKGIAVSRLNSILMQDRAGFSESSLQMMKEEMLECIAKYMEIDEENFGLQLDPGENTTILNLSIPVIRAHTDEEVDKILKEKEEDTRQRAIKMVLDLEDMINEHAKAISEMALKENSKEDKDEETLEENEEDKDEETLEENEEAEVEESSENNEDEEKSEDIESNEETKETEVIKDEIEEETEETEETQENNEVAKEVDKEKPTKKTKKEEE